MKKVLYSFLWILTVGSFLFLTSCGEDTEDPVPLTVIDLTSTDKTIENDAVVAAPGETFGITVAADNEEVTAVTNGPISVNGTNTATNDVIEFTVDPTAELGGTAEITFTTTSGLSEQLTVTVGYATLVDVVTFADGFSLLREALTSNQAVLDALVAAAPVTVFAPTDDAFRIAGINTADDLPENIAQILSYHVVEGAVLSTDLEDGASVPTLEGSNIEVTIDGDVISINGVPVAAADIETEDGNVVHVIGSVLDPSFSITTSTAVLLGGQGNPTEGSFYNAVDNEVLLFSEASANSGSVDFLYYWGATNNHSIAALDDGGAQAVFTAVQADISGFDPQPETRFLSTEITDVDFDAIVSQSDLEDAFLDDQDINQTGVTGLAVGSVFIVELDDDRGGNVGLVRVAEIVEPENGNGAIRLDIKLTK
ncbi:MAG: fasciclin domain-containing protein [Cyclobacteriaceae bacterium]